MALLRASADNQRIQSVIYCPSPFSDTLYLLHGDSPKVARYVQDDIYLIETLAEFQHVENAGHNVGADVRVHARDLFKLFADGQNLAEVRWRRRGICDCVAGKKSGESDDEPSEALLCPNKSQVKRSRTSGVRLS
jgi:epsin